MAEQLKNFIEVSEPHTKKTCVRCKHSKPLSSFRKDKETFHIRCKDCDNYCSRVTYKIRKTAPRIPKTCQCCGRDVNVVPGKKLIIDHDHKTDEFRGWICDSCNTGIGKLGDNIEGVLNAIRYLERIRDGIPHPSDSSEELI